MAPEAGTLDVAAQQAQLRRLQQDLHALDRDLDRLTGLRGGVGQLCDAVHQLDRVAAILQKTVIDTRMAPIGPLFGRFRRVVRDITRGLDKEVRLVVAGEKTELDKRMIDELGDPLIHLVRNSLDHGIETREERLRAGKPAAGELRLTARRQGNRIAVEVRDDGRGLNQERILSKAVERNLIGAGEAAQMTDRQAFELIWRPGFSTAETVTQISGRGMGMDIVRAKIEELHGSVETESRPGQGTTFTIYLPLTLAVLPALLVEVNAVAYAIPVEAVVKIVQVKPQDLHTVYGATAAAIRGRTVGMCALNELFRRHNEAATPENSAPTAQCDGAATLRQAPTLVVVGLEGQEVGIPVDWLLGEQDVVIQSLAVNYRHVPGIAGASILGDGRVSLILDPAALLDAACGFPIAT